VAQVTFPRWRASIRALVRGGGWRWALATGFAVALGGGAWAYDVFGPEIRASWPRWKVEGAPWVRNTLLWLEFLASMTLTIAILCWCTALLFCLLSALVFSLPRLLSWFCRRFPSCRRLDQARRTADAIAQRERIVGTLLNLLAGLGALVTLTVVLGRSLDLWDLGIQAAISAAIELIVLEILFAEGRLGWPTRKVP
jgi:hypothetical protein